MTGWLRGRSRGTGLHQALFEQMWDDAAIHLAAFAPGARIFAIASAGCNARALSALDCLFTAVDINPVQLPYARSRGPVQDGAAAHGLADLRRLAPLAGWTAGRLNSFLHLQHPVMQLAILLIDANMARFRLRLAAPGKIRRGVPPRARTRLRPSTEQNEPVPPSAPARRSDPGFHTGRFHRRPRLRRTLDDPAGARLVPTLEQGYLTATSFRSLLTNNVPFANAGAARTVPSRSLNSCNFL